MCVDRLEGRVLRYWSLHLPSTSLVVGVLPSTLLPGFTGPKSPVLRVDLPPFAPHRFGFSSSVQFYSTFDSLQCQVGRASLGKTYRLPRCRPASRRLDSPDIRSCLFTPAQPSPQRHIAGSLFATYPGSTSYFLRTRHSWRCPCPVGVALPSGNGARFTSGQRPEDRQVRHARRTWSPTGKPVAPSPIKLRLT